MSLIARIVLGLVKLALVVGLTGVSRLTYLDGRNLT